MSLYDRVFLSDSKLDETDAHLRGLGRSAITDYGDETAHTREVRSLLRAGQNTEAAIAARPLLHPILVDHSKRIIELRSNADIDPWNRKAPGEDYADEQAARAFRAKAKELGVNPGMAMPSPETVNQHVNHINWLSMLHRGHGPLHSYRNRVRRSISSEEGERFVPHSTDDPLDGPGSGTTVFSTPEDAAEYAASMRLHYPHFEVSDPEKSEFEEDGNKYIDYRVDHKEPTKVWRDRIKPRARPASS